MVAADGFEGEFREWVGDGFTSAAIYIGLVLAVIAIVMMATSRS